MRKLLITLDDELDTLLAGEANQNEIVRQALRLYKSDITTDTRENLVATLKLLIKLNKEIDSKIDFIAKGLQ